MGLDFKEVSICETLEKKQKKKKKKLATEAVIEVGEDSHERKAESELRNLKKKSRKKVNDESHEEGGKSSSLLEESAAAAHKKHKKKGREKVIDKSQSPQAQENCIGEGDDTLTKDSKASGFSTKKRKKMAISEDAVQSEKKKGKKNDKKHEDRLESSSREADGTTAGKAKGKASSSKKKKKRSCDEEPASKEKARRVSFSGDVEVFPPHNYSEDEIYDENNLVHGRRFSAEEDQLIRDAVDKYIEINQLGEDGLKMLLNCRRNPGVRNCWEEIGTALPWRPHRAVRSRAHIIFERSEKRGFTEEESEIIRKFYAEHGSQWKKLAEILGKQEKHIKDKWRRMRLPNVKRGPWSQDEYQCLFDSVNLNLRMRAFEETKSSNVMVRENISWEAISDKLTTRNMSSCCHKWYDQLTSPLVRESLWADTDDYWLLAALHKQDACNIEDVEWDNLLKHRSGKVCQRRWEEMVRHIGGYRERTFLEQVDVLAKRYCDDMLQYRKENNMS